MGRQARLPEPSTPLQDRRQVLAFGMHVEGRSIRSIAQELHVDRATACLDVAMEGKRRAIERRHERKALIALACRRYERVIARANRCLEGMTNPAHIAEQERIIIAAQSRLDLLWGLTFEPS